MIIDDQLTLKLYHQGLSDKQIAAHTGNHYKSIARWRRIYGLESNVGQGKRGPDKRKRRERNGETNSL